MKKIILFLVVICSFISSCQEMGLGAQQNATEEPVEDPNALILPGTLSQWAVSASASSAYGSIHGEGDWTPSSVIGTPDVELCEDNGKAWAPEQEDDDLQWIEVGYDDELYLTGVVIRESYGPGAITMIEAKDGENYVTLFDGIDPNDDCPGDFVFLINDGELNKTDFATDTLRITIDTDVEGWNEIDAIQMIGYEQNWEIQAEGNITKVVFK